MTIVPLWISSGMTYRELMRNSEFYVEYALEQGDEHEQIVTHRLTETNDRYHDWELRHSKLMKKVSRSASTQTEIQRLRETAISLLHVSALSRYIKRRAVKGEDREILMNSFHPCRDYVDAILFEHANFIRAETSSMCSHFLTARLGDLGIENWFESYRNLLDDYFGMFCDRTIADAKGQRYLMRPLILEAKAELIGQRVKILNSAVRFRQYHSVSPSVRVLVKEAS